MDTNRQIERLWMELNDKCKAIADLLDTNSTSNTISYRLVEVRDLTNRIKSLQLRTDYDGHNLLVLPDGTKAFADVAIYGGMMFVRELERDVQMIGNSKSDPLKNANYTFTTNQSRDNVTGGIALCAVSVFFFVLFIISFVNTTSGKIDGTLGVILCVITLGITGAAAFFSYISFSERN